MLHVVDFFPKLVIGTTEGILIAESINEMKYVKISE